MTGLLTDTRENRNSKNKRYKMRKSTKIKKKSSNKKIIDQICLIFFQLAVSQNQPFPTCYQDHHSLHLFFCNITKQRRGNKNTKHVNRRS